jgi:hypothetical protein
MEAPKLLGVSRLMRDGGMSLLANANQLDGVGVGDGNWSAMKVERAIDRGCNEKAHRPPHGIQSHRDGQ